MRRAFPDIRVDVDDVLAEGDQIACRLTAHATHSGDGLGVPPTGRPVTFTALAWARWREGRMVEGWNEFDSASVMAQIATGQPVDKAGSTVAVKPHRRRSVVGRQPSGLDRIFRALCEPNLAFGRLVTHSTGGHGWAHLTDDLQPITGLL